MKKPVTHYQYLTDPQYTKPVKIKLIEHYVTIKENKFSDKIGRVVSTLKKVKKSSRSLAKYRVSEFAIDNLQISGAINNLTQTFCTRDKLSTLSNLTAAAINIAEPKKNK